LDKEQLVPTDAFLSDNGFSVGVFSEFVVSAAPAILVCGLDWMEEMN